ncbi:hypothetical protein PsorP6_009745 [Peronosclerospora sorghi]|uniref:Uncharacterized protein n=1 Tax=Peronosclerospora sorghi TaxID=230839 RepID=A0ACC0W055_9STRA|nr:hypothetical protein PsorP6_009745 [Peronosclerospora sorghi]
MMVDLSGERTRTETEKMTMPALFQLRDYIIHPLNVSMKLTVNDGNHKMPITHQELSERVLSRLGMPCLVKAIDAIGDEAWMEFLDRMPKLAGERKYTLGFVFLESGKEYPTQSGIKPWVDPTTPARAYEKTTSRGDRWHLVMSDEFNVPHRSFRPGADHLWTSLEKPDGVNGALEVYAHNLTSTACAPDGTCYFYIKAVDEVTTLTVYNAYLPTPAYENVSFYYRAAMVQSWNKFCYQGGLVEVRVQLPGAVSQASGNPDVARGQAGRVTSGAFYPTWPGIWMMGNLGRAIFSASTSRMWPFSYNECAPDVFDPRNQRISACDDNPGYGLNKRQGRGAPEIDLLEGGGTTISSSVQIAPGMPRAYRVFPAEETYDGHDMACVYTYKCQTPGANGIDIPTAYYATHRGHKSWYQGLRYGANHVCTAISKEQQSLERIQLSLTTGITENRCTTTTCPASFDPNSDLGLVDGTGPAHWGINTNGTCFAVMNSYMGAYLCDPDNTDTKCLTLRNATTTSKRKSMEPFNYQMDAISANWAVHLGAYTDYFVYQVEWVTGPNGYVRWMGAGQPLFEVSSDSLTSIPQNRERTNPKKLMVEEPMSIIMNVALSRSWSAVPPNPGRPCRGDGRNEQHNRICNDFPMYMKIDYIRLYQDTSGTTRGPGDYMQLGCDPPSHPTREWILGHLDEYQDSANPWIEVSGKAFCRTNDDCTIRRTGKQRFVTGRCLQSRCTCLYPDSWGGPRCTFAISEASTRVNALTHRTYGPPMAFSISVAVITLFSTLLVAWNSILTLRQQEEEAMEAAEEKKMDHVRTSLSARWHVSSYDLESSRPKDNYSQNFL